MKLRDISIQAQLLISFFGIALVSMLLISGLTLNNISSIGENTIDLSTQELKDQIITNIGKNSEENSRIIEQKFSNAEGAVQRIVKATEELFKTDSAIGERPSYPDSEFNTTLPDNELDPTYGEVISKTTSTYYYPGTLTPQMNETVKRSSSLDLVFRSIYAENPNYVWLYVAFKDGVFRNFPGAAVDLDKEYNPPQEDWYIEAVDLRGDLTYSPPYMDITQGLVISLTQAVYIDGDLIGVVGLDFKTTTIRDKVLDVNFLDSGYAFLMQKDDYTLVAHPQWDSENQGVDDDIPKIWNYEKNFDDSSAIDDAALATLSTDESGTVEYEKKTLVDGQPVTTEYILSFSTIRSRSGVELYDFIVTVPLEEAISVVRDIQSNINAKKESLTQSITTVVVVILATVLVVGTLLSRSITKPISKLTAIARQITQNATKEDIFDGVVIDSSIESDDEIGELTRSFSDMVSTLREESKKKKAK